MSESEPIGGARTLAQLDAECRRLTEALALSEQDRQLLAQYRGDDLGRDVLDAEDLAGIRPAPGPVGQGRSKCPAESRAAPGG